MKAKMPARMFLVAMYLVVLSISTILLTSCGGGGEGGGDDPDNEGWITTFTPTSTNFSTESSALIFKGEAFISPSHGCCSGPVDIATGVVVNWENVTTCESG